MKKIIKKVEVIEEWRKGWATPDVYVYKGRGRNRRRFLLREHTIGEMPFVQYKNKYKIF